MKKLLETPRSPRTGEKVMASIGIGRENNKNEMVHLGNKAAQHGQARLPSQATGKKKRTPNKLQAGGYDARDEGGCARDQSSRDGRRAPGRVVAEGRENQKPDSTK